MLTLEEVRRVEPRLSNMSDDELEEALRLLQDLAQLAVDDLLSESDNGDGQRNTSVTPPAHSCRLVKI